MADEKNPAFMFQMTDKELLLKAIWGEINLQELLEKEMINRGLSPITGEWVGPRKSAALFKAMEVEESLENGYLNCGCKREIS